MPLTLTEKSAGKAFREQCQELLSGIPAAALCSPFIPWYRHQCRDSETEGTWAMHLREHWWLSPQYQVPGEWGQWKSARPVETVREGLFAFVFRQGTCSRCRLRVRSGTGRLVLAEHVPPGKGAIVERKPENGHLPEGQAVHQAAP